MMKLTGRMRYRSSGGDWINANYSMSSMSYIILNDFEYELEGRDY